MGLLSIFRPLRYVIVCLLGACLATPAHAQTVATTVPLILPSAAAFDAQGNLYFVETANHVVRKVDTAGNLSTVAGRSGVQGFAGDGEAATAALLDSPEGIAVDTANLYIADTHNHRIRKVSLAGGVITTIAGGNAAGDSGDGGPASTATLDAPATIAVDTKGNLYIADVRRHRIREIDLGTGVIRSVAGTGTQGFDGDGGPAAAAALDAPSGMAVDSQGNIYLADTHNSRVRRIDAATGAVSTVAGSGGKGYSGDAGAASAAKLALPKGISIDGQGNIYIADSANHRVRRIDAASGVITTIAGNGAQGFSGDGGAATEASFDSPRAVSVKADSIAISDTGNRRIREIAGSSVQTVAGLGAVTPGALAISGPAVVSYGSGRLLAKLSGAGATGEITFLDSYSGATNSVATVMVSGNSAELDISTLAAGNHWIVATYGGDASHGAAQSSVFPLTVSPLSISATVVPASIRYGEAVPQLTGALSGVLPRDQSAVTATFASTATTLSPVGSYPVVVTLAGTAAGNYTVGAVPNIRIAQAPTMTTVSASAASVNAGDAVTLTANVASGTTGVPTGTVVLQDGASVIATGRANAAGDFVFVTSTLGAGVHNITALYPGDGNFLASTSSLTALTVNGTQSVPGDFSLAASGASTQTVVSGASASFTFNAQMQGNLSSAIVLSASGLPNLATASFNPPLIPPGSSSAMFTLTIATPKAEYKENRRRRTIEMAMLLCWPVGWLLRRRLRAGVPALLMVMLLSVSLMLCAGCGDRIYTGVPGADLSKTYSVTVTGTAAGTTGGAVQHATTVTLVVLPSS